MSQPKKEKFGGKVFAMSGMDEADVSGSNS